MNELDVIAQKYVTDKKIKRGCHGYTRYYEQYFKPLRYDPIIILEIGVRASGPGWRRSGKVGGESLKLWSEYFPNALIYGIDIKERYKQFETERIKIFIGNQADPAFLKEVLKSMVGPPSIVIDDGSHVCEHQKISITHLFPYIDYGGYYIIEDLETSYGRKFHLGHKGNTIEFLKDIVDDVNYPVHREKFSPFTHYVSAVHFYHNMTVIMKKQASEVYIGMADVILELIVKNNLKKIAHVGVGSPKLCKGVLAPYGVRKNIEEYWAIDEWQNENNFNLTAGLRSWAFNLRLLRKPLALASADFDVNYFDMIILELPPDYDLVTLMIQHWKEKLKAGGFLVGYGYKRRGWGSLTRAVDKELGEVLLHPSHTWVKQL